MRTAPNDKAYRLYRLYYSSVHLVIDHVVDDNGDVWYQLKDDEYPGVKEYVRAEGLRRILPKELTPISPLVKDKRIEVSLKDQKLYAYRRRYVGLHGTLRDRGAFHDRGHRPGRFYDADWRPYRGAQAPVAAHARL